MTPKIGRNSLCPCGSGKKYKKCCLSKDSPQESNAVVDLSIDQFCQLLEWGLQQYPLDQPQKIRTKSVKLLNNTTLACEFYPYAQKSVDIKGEICSIMAFMSSFSKDSPWTPKSLQSFSVAAYTRDNEQIMYAISSKETAEFTTGQGKSLEWLSNTLFQDNSEDFRQTRAKSQISEIENALRKMVSDVLLNTHGANWWNVSIDQNIRQNAENVYEHQHGVRSTDGAELLNFTYLRHLKTIITQNWPAFNSILGERSQFEDWMDELNLIRRDDAHNRPITVATMTKLEGIYSGLLEGIAQVYPEITQGYLLQNWRIQICDIAEQYSKGFQPLPHVKNQHDLEKSIHTLRGNILLLGNTVTQLSSVVIPIGKKKIHDELTNIFQDMKRCFENVVRNYEEGDVNGFIAAAEQYSVVSQRIPELQKTALLSEGE